jgi:single-strand DNA-binding protein
MGRLTADVIYRTGKVNTARYTLAVNRKFSKDNEADFPQCLAFGKAADFAEKYFKKGTKVTVSGRIQTGSYTNKDGVKVYTTEVVVEEQEFAEGKNASSGAASNPSSPDSGPENNPTVPGVSDFMNIPEGISEEELPFS